MKNKRLIANIIELAVGVVLLVCVLLGYLDEFWGGMGGALIGVSGVLLWRTIKYRTNVDYREKVDIENNDERNKYIGMKAWSWAGYLFVLIAAIATIGFKLAGNDTLMMACSSGVCLMLVLYWVSYLVLRGKY